MALRPALQFVLVTCLTIPAVSLIGAILGLSWSAVVFLFSLADLHKERRFGSAETIRFSAQSFVAGLYGFATVGSAWLILQLHREREQMWLQMVPLAIAALAFYGWPRSVVCAKDDVSQRGLFGRKRRIPYAAVQAISILADGATAVIGAGTTIEHTPYHFGAAHFRAIISRRTGKPVYG
ncbi:MAG: hypothetical protein JST93_20895 [Acidobacteria bacterium]|nr:hypothetical protein [Acidobacteriota bacterium]